MAVASHGLASQGPSEAPSGRFTQAFVPQAFVPLGLPRTAFALSDFPFPMIRMGRRPNSAQLVDGKDRSGYGLSQRLPGPQQLSLLSEEICGAKSPTSIDGKDWSGLSGSGLPLRIGAPTPIPRCRLWGGRAPLNPPIRKVASPISLRLIRPFGDFILSYRILLRGSCAAHNRTGLRPSAGSHRFGYAESWCSQPLAHTPSG